MARYYPTRNKISLFQKAKRWGRKLLWEFFSKLIHVIEPDVDLNWQILERKCKWYGYIYMYSRIWIAKTSKGKKNWFKKLKVWDMRGKIKIAEWAEGNNFWCKKSGGWRSQGFEKSRFHFTTICNQTYQSSMTCSLMGYQLVINWLVIDCWWWSMS